MTDNERPDKATDSSGEPKRSEAKPPQADNAEQQPTGAEGGAGMVSDDNAATTEQPRRGGRGSLVVAVLALLIALIAAAAVVALGYLGQQRSQSLGKRVATAEQAVETNAQDVLLPRIRELESRMDELATTVEQRGRAVSRLQDNLRQTQSQLTDLAELVQGGRRQWQLLEVEDLMLAANQRLQLEHDPQGARRALEIVNRRLGELNDPRLFDIREKVVNEIAALEALPDPDIEGLALKLTSLSQRVRKLPLASDVPDEYAGSDPGDDGGDRPGAPAWRHFLNSVDEALDGMLTIRRSGGAHEPLMPPEQSFFLYQNLQLKLQTARLSLLKREPESYRANLSSAREWLNTFFDTGDAGVSAAIETIGQMKKVRIDWEAPDITGSLSALRAFLDRTQGQGRQPANGDDTASENSASGE